MDVDFDGLVLLMTPALAFFYGGRCGQERPEHDDDELHLARILGVLWAVTGYSLASPREQLPRRRLQCVPPGCRTGPQGHHPHTALHELRGRSASSPRRSSRRQRRAACGSRPNIAFIHALALAVYGAGAHWVLGRRLPGRTWRADFAGGTVVHSERGGRGARGGLVSARGVTTEGGRSRRTTCRFTLLGTGLLWFGWFGSTPAARWPPRHRGARLTTTMLAPAGTLVVWALSTCSGRSGRPRWRRHRDCRGPWWPSRRRRLRRADERHHPRRIAAIPSYFCLLCAAKTNLDDLLDVVAAHASAAPLARCSPRVRPEGPERPRDGCCSATRGRWSRSDCRRLSRPLSAEW